MTPLGYTWIYFAAAYSISGHGMENLKAKHRWLWKILNDIAYRRKYLLMVLTWWLVFVAYPELPVWKILLCGVGFFGVHFCGWWEGSWFKNPLTRGVVEGVAFIPVAFVFDKWGLLPLQFGFCVIGFGGAMLLRCLDPHKKILRLDWWSVSLAWIGAWIGLALGMVL